MVQLPQIWQHIEIIDEIGHGAYGTVYEAMDHRRECACAIKVITLPGDPAETEYIRMQYGDAASAYCENLARAYILEIDLLKELKDHPNVVRIEDYALVPNEEGICWQIFIRMELLHELSEPVSMVGNEAQVIALGIDICEALETCRKHRIIHRDLKPGNILRDDEGRFKLTDFGVARHYEKTAAHSVKGTFAYMAPEIYSGGSYGHQADLYALGLIMYQLMNRNREPLVNLEKKMIYFKDREDAYNRRMNGEPLPAPAQASAGLSEIILKACAYSEDKRYKTAEEMKQDLWALKLGSYKPKHKEVAFTAGKKKEISYQKKKTIRNSITLTLGAVMLLTLIICGGLHCYRHFHFDTDQMPEGSMINGYGVLKTDGSHEMAYICAYKGSLNVHDLKKVIITEPITAIPKDMFKNCYNLTEVILTQPEQVTQVGMGAFYGCEQLTALPALPEVTEIGAKACYQCKQLKQLVLPQSLKEIGPWAFYGCESLESVTIPEGIEKIYEHTFEDCYHLRQVNLPETVRCIYDYAFAGCNALEKVDYPQGNHVEYYGTEAITEELR